MAAVVMEGRMGTSTFGPGLLVPTEGWKQLDRALATTLQPGS